MFNHVFCAWMDSDEARAFLPRLTFMVHGFAFQLTPARLQPKEHGSRAGTDRRERTEYQVLEDSALRTARGTYFFRRATPNLRVMIRINCECFKSWTVLSAYPAPNAKRLVCVQSRASSTRGGGSLACQVWFARSPACNSGDGHSRRMGCLLSCFHDGEGADAHYVHVKDGPLQPAPFAKITPHRYGGKADTATPADDENTPAQNQLRQWASIISPVNRSPFSPVSFFSPGMGLQPSEGFQSPNMAGGM